MDRILIVCGPTGVGKTSLALCLAKKFDGELVSADSRQVYRGMDVGTGKDLPRNPKFEILNPKQIQDYQIGYYLVKGIRLWLLDIVEPDYQFSVADYVKCANVVIGDIWKRGRLPILVGGTGFYIKALVDGIETLGVPPDWELREKLRNLEIKKLREILKEIAPERLEKMNESDRNNPRRLVRAIEIAKSKPLYHCTSTVGQRANTLFIGLMAPYKELYKRIDQRVEERVKQGVEKEIRKLLSMGYSWENSVLGETIGYKEWRGVMEDGRWKMEDGKTRREIIQRWKFAEHGYARRQMAWFRRDSRIFWFDLTEEAWQDKVEQLVRSWYNSLDAEKS